MPRSFSRSFESITRSATRWFSRNEPDCCRSLSTSVVLPWSTWAMMAMLRRFMGVDLDGGAAIRGVTRGSKPDMGRFFRSCEMSYPTWRNFATGGARSCPRRHRHEPVRFPGQPMKWITSAARPVRLPTGRPQASRHGARPGSAAAEPSAPPRNRPPMKTVLTRLPASGRSAKMMCWFEIIPPCTPMSSSTTPDDQRRDARATRP